MNSEDIALWPDGTWCFLYDLSQYGFKSDDYEILPEGSAGWVKVSMDT